MNCRTISFKHIQQQEILIRILQPSLYHRKWSEKVLI